LNVNNKSVHGNIHNISYSFTSTNPEESLLYLNEEVLIIGDISIHNKKELYENFKLRKVFSDKEDHELIGQMYLLKGIECLNDLVGEFTFILIDINTSETFIVRDQIGVRTNFWIKKENGYIISSDIFLLQPYFNIRNINKSYFKEFHVKNGIVDSLNTPYIEVNRLPSGHFINLSSKSIKITNYWDLSNIKKTIKYKNEDEYINEFNKIFSDAVHSRLIKNQKNSIMLSGGLDSTSIYAVSKLREKKEKSMEVRGFSAVFDDMQECDERFYIEKLLNKYNDHSNFLNFDNILMFENFPYSSPFSLEPNVNAISFNFTYNIVKEATINGYDNILSGYAGDHLLTGSLYVTKDLVKKMKLKKTFSYLTNYSIATNTSAIDNFKKYTLFPKIINDYIKDEKSPYYKEMRNKDKKIKHYHQKELYFQITNAKSHIYTDRIIGALTQSTITHPFLDRRLIEYLYKIPGEIKYQNEQTKYLLRKSMENYLPEEIINRQNKTTHLAYTYKGIKKNWDKIYKIMENPLIVRELNLISKEAWIEELKKWRNGVDPKEDFWTLFAIEIWLVQYQDKTG